MNYKVSKIENISVSNFHVSGDILYLFNKSMKSLYKISDDKIDLILKRDDLFYLVIWNNIMHISGNIFFDIENNKEMKLEKFNIESEDYIECFVLNDNKLYAKKFTKFNDIVFLKINEDFSFNTIKHIGNPRLIFNQISIEFIDNSIQVVDNVSNKLIWQTHFKDLCGVDTVYPQNEVLESNEKLYIAISSQGGRKGLFVLDLKTGKEIGFYKDLIFRPFKDNDFIYTSAYQNKFCKIDTKSENIEIYDFKELLKINGFESLHDHRFCVSNNILYFTQTLGSKVAKLGVIDLNNQTMVYKYDFPKKSGAIGSIQVINERIYVHTQDNTLHIFQKENPSI